jgi:hypothetical protein
VVQQGVLLTVSVTVCLYSQGRFRSHQARALLPSRISTAQSMRSWSSKTAPGCLPRV